MGRNGTGRRQPADGGGCCVAQTGAARWSGLGGQAEQRVYGHMISVDGATWDGPSTAGARQSRQVR